MSNIENSAIQQISFVLFTVTAVLLISFLSLTAYKLYAAGERVANTELELATLKQRQRELQRELHWRQSSLFQEEQIREQLYLSRENDYVLDITIAEASKSSVLLQPPAIELNASDPVVLQWAQLLLGVE